MKSGVTNRGTAYGSRLPPGTAWVNARWMNPNFDARYNPEPPIVPAFKKSRRDAIRPPILRVRGFEICVVWSEREKRVREGGPTDGAITPVFPRKSTRLRPRSGQ